MQTSRKKPTKASVPPQHSWKPLKRHADVLPLRPHPSYFLSHRHHRRQHSSPYTARKTARTEISPYTWDGKGLVSDWKQKHTVRDIPNKRPDAASLLKNEELRLYDRNNSCVSETDSKHLGCLAWGNNVTRYISVGSVGINGSSRHIGWTKTLSDTRENRYPLFRPYPTTQQQTHLLHSSRPYLMFHRSDQNIDKVEPRCAEFSEDLRPSTNNVSHRPELYPVVLTSFGGSPSRDDKHARHFPLPCVIVSNRKDLPVRELSESPALHAPSTFYAPVSVTDKDVRDDSSSYGTSVVSSSCDPDLLNQTGNISSDEDNEIDVVTVSPPAQNKDLLEDTEHDILPETVSCTCSVASPGNNGVDNVNENMKENKPEIHQRLSVSLNRTNVNRTNTYQRNGKHCECFTDSSTEKHGAGNTCFQGNTLHSSLPSHLSNTSLSSKVSIEGDILPPARREAKSPGFNKKLQGGLDMLSVTGNIKCESKSTLVKISDSQTENKQTRGNEPDLQSRSHRTEASSDESPQHSKRLKAAVCRTDNLSTSESDKQHLSLFPRERRKSVENSTTDSVASAFVAENKGRMSHSSSGNFGLCETAKQIRNSILEESYALAQVMRYFDREYEDSLRDSAQRHLGRVKNGSYTQLLFDQTKTKYRYPPLFSRNSTVSCETFQGFKQNSFNCSDPLLKRQIIYKLQPLQQKVSSETQHQVVSRVPAYLSLDVCVRQSGQLELTPPQSCLNMKTICHGIV